MSEGMNIDEALWNYIDGTLAPGEQALVEKMIRTDQEWQAKHAELLEVHQLMGEGIQLEAPSMRFTKNVMEEISRIYIAPATKKYLNKNIIRGIGLFFLISIAGLIVYTFGQVDWSQPSTVDMPQLPIERKQLDLLHNNTYLNIFIMVNILLGLMLTDMYLRRRKDDAQVH
jgi:hypothetical protein